MYIHVPFCASKCDYCAFATWTDRSHLIDSYLDAVATEIDRSVEMGMLPATSVFIGGGTPTLVDPQRLADVISRVPRAVSIGAGADCTGRQVRDEGRSPPRPRDVAEVTVECNPDDLNAALVATYVDAGVNRLSIGVQSTQPGVLAELGRSHRGDNIVAAIEAAQGPGIASFNLDLIFGSRAESIEKWRDTVEDVVSFGPPHVSAYGLSAEPGTPIGADERRHPQPDDQADKYEIVDRRFADVGLENYEISNWARPGHECRHNLLYWQQGNYRGFGCGAHSHQDGRRWWNLRTPQRYIEAVSRGDAVIAASEELTPYQRRIERLDLALRTSAGVPAAEVALDAVHSLNGLVELTDDDRVVLTRRGRLLANEVSVRLGF